MAEAGRRESFAALRRPAFRNYFICATFAATGDSVEHVASYWVLFKQFNSPTLGGVAVLTHWLPFLLFSVYAGALADRFDPRRLLQVSQNLMMLVSLGWALLLLTGTLNESFAVMMLVFHGLFGVFALPAMQLMVHELVEPEHLQSAVRINASTRQLGLLLGPALGGTLMLVLSPMWTLILNMACYLPIVIWASRARRSKPYVKPQRGPSASGFREIFKTVRMVAKNRTIISMIALVGGASLFIGNAYQPQMPEFAHDLHHEHGADAGVFYNLLLSADAVGAISAVLILEGRGLLNAHPRTAMILTMCWCLALGGFAAATSYWIAIPLMFAAGFFSLSFNAMAQTLVQMRAPPEARGRIMGLFGAASMGLRAFSGVTIGVLGGLIGIHWSLAASALALLTVAVVLLALSVRPAR